MAYEKTKLVTSKRKELENLLGHVDILSEEQATELSAQFQKIDADYQKLEAEKLQLNSKQQWFERKQKIDNEIILKQSFSKINIE